jgi:hypothetical protein
MHFIYYLYYDAFAQSKNVEPEKEPLLGNGLKQQ